MSRLAQVVREIRDMLEDQRQLEAESEPAGGCYIERIEIVSVEPGHQVVKPEDAELLRELRMHNLIPAAWRELLKREPPKPRLVSDVVDADTGQYLDPLTLEPFPPAS
jgi:hypothetical protein